ncbi:MULTISPECIES: hypothetical protein [Halolamina]|uniref:DUF7992 domain-containing protein n=1 Tax=Halolamina pelagica TaxID=699431 RepID=A0A1I5ULW0_9EURY|nr:MULTISPECIES: hypothetical protein [Halolamina]SFP96047.1 hypothetical protein SAMN05216277_11327 [Halolamina pelagica]
MILDVSIPEPPDLSNRGRPSSFDWEESEIIGSEDFYREDLENLLQEGAWREGFEEWAEYTDLDEEEVRVVDDLDLFQAFDFYRDPTDDHLRYDAPTVPEDWREREVTESLDSSRSRPSTASYMTSAGWSTRRSRTTSSGPATPPTGMRNPSAIAKSRAR